MVEYRKRKTKENLALGMIPIIGEKGESLYVGAIEKWFPEDVVWDGKNWVYPSTGHPHRHNDLVRARTGNYYIIKYDEIGRKKARPVGLDVATRWLYRHNYGSSGIDDSALAKMVTEYKTKKEDMLPIINENNKWLRVGSIVRIFPEDMIWNGKAWVFTATGQRGYHEDLVRTRKGDYYVVMSPDMEYESPKTARRVNHEKAAQWLARNKYKPSDSWVTDDPELARMIAQLRST